MSKQAKSQHTPGPWKANPLTRPAISIALTRPAISIEQRDPTRGTTICTIARVSIAQNPNAFEDAALIAAAPALLEALCELLDVSASYDEGGLLARAKARAAIAAAEGKS